MERAMTQDLRDTAFIRRYRQVAGSTFQMLFGAAALVGLAGFAGPIVRLIEHAKSLGWSEMAGPLSILLVSLVGWVSMVGVRHANRREDAARAAKPLETKQANVR
jgi:hypothetical protein